MAGRKPKDEPPAGEPQPLLTKEKVAVILDSSIETVNRLIRERQLPVIRLGDAVKIRPESLQKWLERIEQEGAL